MVILWKFLRVLVWNFIVKCYDKKLIWEWFVFYKLIRVIENGKMMCKVLVCDVKLLRYWWRWRDVMME